MIRKSHSENRGAGARFECWDVYWVRLGKAMECAQCCGFECSIVFVYWLVVRNMNFIFHVLGIIIPTDFPYFSEGLKPPTSITLFFVDFLFEHKSKQTSLQNAEICRITISVFFSIHDVKGFGQVMNPASWSAWFSWLCLIQCGAIPAVIIFPLVLEKGPKEPCTPGGVMKKKTGLLYLFHDHSRLATDLTNDKENIKIFPCWLSDDHCT